MRSHGKVSIVSCLHSIDTSYHIIPTVSYAPQHGHGSYFMLFVIQCLNLLANNTVALTTFHLTIHVFVGIDKRFISHFGNQTLQTADRFFVCFGQASWHLDKKDHFRPCLSPVPKYTLLQIVKVLHVNLQKQILSNNIAQNPQFQKRNISYIITYTTCMYSVILVFDFCCILETKAQILAEREKAAARQAFETLDSDASGR